jgi:hypothetical protein
MLIVRAAIMYSNGEVVEGRDYQSINSLAYKLGLSGDHINGFLNSSGEFVLPKDAAAIALKSGQIKKSTDELQPTDIWPSVKAY